MQLNDVARRLPAEVWAVFEPVLPPVVWKGNGRPPIGNDRVLHALLYVLVSGVGWDLLPNPPFPSGKTVRRRLRVWLELDVFRATWAQLAARYQRLRGINWDQVLIDGCKRPAKKGARRRARAPWTAASAART
jgi:transposase